MADANPRKKCKVDGDECKRDVRALCYHCSKNFCHVHLQQHAQLVETETCKQLNSFADALNELSAQFDALSISPDILEKPFVKIEQWRVDSHAQIDQMAERKRQEINEKIDEYRKIFAIKNEEQVTNIRATNAIIQKLIHEADASRKQMDELQASIDEKRKYLSSIHAHAIQVDTYPPRLFINICPDFFDSQPASDVKLREFNINYIRLSGVVRRYSIKTKQTGTINDLINSFVRQASVYDRFVELHLEASYTTHSDPKHDFILATEVYNHRVHMTYKEDHKLDAILLRDVIVFHETPHSLVEENNPRILMPCKFHRLPEKKPFAWPIYLAVPRQQCRGQDILDALHAAIGHYFSIDPDKDQQLYNATLEIVSTANSLRTTKALNHALKDHMDFNKTATILIVTIDKNVADMYEKKYG